MFGTTGKFDELAVPFDTAAETDFELIKISLKKGVSAVGEEKEAAASAALRILRHEPKEGILFRFRHRY